MLQGKSMVVTLVYKVIGTLILEPQEAQKILIDGGQVVRVRWKIGAAKIQFHTFVRIVQVPTANKRVIRRQFPSRKIIGTMAIVGPFLKKTSEKNQTRTLKMLLMTEKKFRKV